MLQGYLFNSVIQQLPVLASSWLNWGIWLLAAIIFVIAELATVMLVSVWFAAGAVIALVVAAFGGPVWLQVLLFILSSFALLGLTWIFRDRLAIGNKAYIPTNADRLVGTEVEVIKKIEALQSGAVRVEKQIWSARAEDKKVIEVGQRVRVSRIEGNHLVVTEAAVSQTEADA